MCGRFARATELEAVLRLLRFYTSELTDLHPRYNVAQSQAVAAVRVEDGQRALVNLRWGLIRSWAKDVKIGFSLINARAETVAEKPALQPSFKSRRCLIPATSFSEWRATGGKHKQPTSLGMRDGALFAFAGLWETSHGGDGEPIPNCTILATEANAVVRPVHDRMPVLIASADFAAWLDPRTPAEDLPPLLRLYAAEERKAVPVGTDVNTPRNEGAQCLPS